MFYILIILSLTYHVVQSIDQNKNINPFLENSTYLVEVDHFRPQDDRVVRGTYVDNLIFWQPGGPIYLFVSDGLNGPAEIQWLLTGVMYDIARETNGALIMADHRYFNTFRITETASFENLAYLTIEQTLVDIAYMIVTVKENLGSPNSKVILWGSGYGGTLAIYARQKYPHLVDGAWSSSGIFRFSPLTTEPYEYLSQSIEKYGGPQCAEHVRYAFNHMANLINNYDTYTLMVDFNMCYELRVIFPEEIAYFFEQQIKFITDYLNDRGDEALENFCDGMNFGNNSYHAWYNWTNFRSGSGCRNYDYFQNIWYRLREIEWDTEATNSGLRQWFYLTCTQIGLQKLTYNATTLFSEKIIEYFHFWSCMDVLGFDYYNRDQLAEAIEQLEMEYGGISPGVTNAIYTNGVLDLMYPLGIHSVTDDNAYVFDVPGKAQSGDLYSIYIFDSEELIQVKQSIMDIIIGWTSSNTTSKLP